MPAYKYKTKEQKEKHLAYRRDNYWKNWEHIRKRDNETARRNRKKKPEQYAAYAKKHNQRRAENSETEVKYEDNPDREEIEREIAREVGVIE